VSIRSSIIALAAVLAFPLAAVAQTDPAAPPVNAPAQVQPAPHHHHHRAGYGSALKSLALTPDQQQQIRALRRANAKAFRDQVAGILTPDQRAQLRATMAQQRSANAPQ
jgi:Spy/CpxP family protein refolding chaperone